MKIAVGSNNPVKIKAAEAAFKKVWPEEDWTVIGVDVDSGVPEQPLSDEESINGATNRAIKAMEKENAFFGVGMEGGLQEVHGKWFDKGWMVVVDQQGRVGVGSTVNIEISNKLMNEIRGGKTLGDVIDKYFDGDDLSMKEGYFGLMTNDLVTRTHGYTDGLIMALTRFIHTALW